MCFHLNEVLEQAEVIYSDRNQICGCGGQGGETEGKGHREILGVMEIFHILIWVVFIGVCICQNSSKCAHEMC